MIVIPINRELNSYRMLNTGKFQTKLWHNEELVWLIRYLLDRKDDEAAIYKIWKRFYKKDIVMEYYDEDTYEDVFKVFMRNAGKCKLNNTKTYIYQEEIDYINSLPVVLWIRQYMFIILLHNRALNQFEQHSFPMNEYKHYLAIKNTNVSTLKYRLISILTKYDFLNKMTYDKELNLRLRFTEPLKGCKNKIEFDTILDALNKINKYINNKLKCSVCGTEFKMSPKCQRDLCDKCYSKKRTAQKHACRKGFEDVVVTPMSKTY